MSTNTVKRLVFAIALVATAAGAQAAGLSNANTRNPYTDGSRSVQEPRSPYSDGAREFNSFTDGMRNADLFYDGARS